AAKAPLDAEARGIAVFSNGVWHETTLAGSEGRELANYIFGEVDVPGLEEDKSPISPFDLSRSMKLNAANKTVGILYGFIFAGVEEVRRELLEAEKQRRASAEARKLAEHAAEIARVINEDFREFRQRVAKVKARVEGQVDILQETGASGDGSDEGLFQLGGESPLTTVSETGGPGARGDGSGGGGEPRTLEPLLKRDEDGSLRGRR